MFKHWKGFVAANIVAGMVVGAGLQLENDTRDHSAKYIMDKVAERAVRAGTCSAICMAIVGVIGVHSRVLWAFLITASFAPTAVEAVAVPITRAVYNARHKKK